MTFAQYGVEDIGQVRLGSPPSVCQSGDPFTVPPNFVPYRLQDYPYVESGLQIFTDFEVPCDGFIGEWRFLSKTHLISSLYLGVFRWQDEQGHWVELVGSTSINNVEINSTDTWQSYSLETPLRVRAGDMLGMFYGMFETSSPRLSIPSRKKTDVYDMEINKLPPTIVMVLDSRYFRNQSKFQ